MKIILKVSLLWEYHWSSLWRLWANQGTPSTKHRKQDSTYQVSVWVWSCAPLIVLFLPFHVNWWMLIVWVGGWASGLRRRFNYCLTNSHSTGMKWLILEQLLSRGTQLDNFAYHYMFPFKPRLFHCKVLLQCHVRCAALSAKMVETGSINLDSFLNGT